MPSNKESATPAKDGEKKSEGKVKVAKKKKYENAAVPDMYFMYAEYTKPTESEPAGILIDIYTKNDEGKFEQVTFSGTGTYVQSFDPNSNPKEKGKDSDKMSLQIKKFAFGEQRRADTISSFAANAKLHERIEKLGTLFMNDLKITKQRVDPKTKNIIEEPYPFCFIYKQEMRMVKKEGSKNKEFVLDKEGNKIVDESYQFKPEAKNFYATKHLGRKQELQTEVIFIHFKKDPGSKTLVSEDEKCEHITREELGDRLAKQKYTYIGIGGQLKAKIIYGNEPGNSAQQFFTYLQQSTMTCLPMAFKNDKAREEAKKKLKQLMNAPVDDDFISAEDIKTSIAQKKDSESSEKKDDTLEKKAEVDATAPLVQESEEDASDEGDEN